MALIALGPKIIPLVVYKLAFNENNDIAICLCTSFSLLFFSRPPITHPNTILTLHTNTSDTKLETNPAYLPDDSEEVNPSRAL